jgi:hypothetical protein
MIPVIRNIPTIATGQWRQQKQGLHLIPTSHILSGWENQDRTEAQTQGSLGNVALVFQSLTQRKSHWKEVGMNSECQWQYQLPFKARRMKEEMSIKK